jgi:hypothetical protein
MSRFSAFARIRTLLSVLVVAAVAMTGGIALAAVTDNLTPTGNYPWHCTTGTADNPGRVCQTDNVNVYYYFDCCGTNALEAEDRDVINDMLYHEYKPTDLAFGYDSTPAFSGTGQTDIVYEEATVTGSAEGITWCNAEVAGGAYYDCDQQFVRMEGGGTISYGLSCHETGHAVGLLHGYESYPRLSNTDSRLGCMMTPVDAFETLGSNNIDQINANY